MSEGEHYPDQIKDISKNLLRRLELEDSCGFVVIVCDQDIQSRVIGDLTAGWPRGSFRLHNLADPELEIPVVDPCSPSYRGQQPMANRGTRSPASPIGKQKGES